MSDTAYETKANASPLDDAAMSGVATIGDYLALLKPRVMSLVVFTAFVGLLIAPGSIHPVVAFTAILCIAVGAGASGALNMWYDADIDAQMTRTKERPIPAGKISPQEALTFGMVLSIFSVYAMAIMVNYIAAALLAFTIFFYVVVYTMWLKRSTPQNIVIGGASGAFPPVIAWAVVTGNVTIEPLVLFAIIFLWTPPHFWSLALYKTGEYQKVGVPMLPVVAGKKSTRTQILLYSLLLVPFTLAPTYLGFAGWLYGATAIVLGLVFLVLAARIVVVGDDKGDAKAAASLFAYSIFYLFALFLSLALDHGLGFSKGLGL